LDRSIDCYSLRAELREIKHEQRVPGPGKQLVGGNPLVLSPTGKTLYAAFADQGISIFRVDPVTGKLSHLQRWSARDRSLSSPILSSDGRRIIAVDDKQQELLSIPVHEESGELGNASAVAKVSVPLCLMMRSAAPS